MSFWQDKSVLVTGADGFIGSNLVKSLLKKKARIITYSRKGVSAHSLLKLEGLTDQIGANELGDIADFARLNEVIKKHKVQVIYHLAAVSLVESGQADPVPTFEVNVAGTWNVLEAARQNSVSKIVIASTVHVYGDNPKLPFKEEYYPRPSRPYETSKACADLVAQCYADSYALGVEIPRFANLYGPGDLNFSRLVPKVIKTVLDGKNPRLWENGAVRDFMYIDDAVSALEVLVEKNLANKKRNRIFNFGTGKPTDILAMAEKIVSLSHRPGRKLAVERIPEDRNREILKQYISISKAKSELGWQPQTKMEDGLRETLDWYTRYYSALQ